MVSFHIEPTSKCTLECPLCDRTWFYETFKKRNLHEINVDNLINFVGTNANVKFCGNNGDPIYHSKFLNLCKKFKDNNCSIHIHTNGSAKTKTWWNKLKNILEKDDCITFAIDGLENTNHLYRKNAKWESIMLAINVLQSRKFKIIWKFIVFQHNQHQIKEAKELSKKLGFDFFRLKKSDRWLDNKELMPDKEYVDNYHEHQSKVLTDKEYRTNIIPNCMINGKPTNELYIDAEGDFYPCCWIGTYRYKYKTIFSPKNKRFNIGNNTLSEILKNQEVINFFNSTKHFDFAHECCKIQCGVNNG